MIQRAVISVSRFSFIFLYFELQFTSNHQPLSFRHRSTTPSCFPAKHPRTLTSKTRSQTATLPSDDPTSNDAILLPRKHRDNDANILHTASSSSLQRHLLHHAIHITTNGPREHDLLGEEWRRGEAAERFPAECRRVKAAPGVVKRLPA